MSKWLDRFLLAALLAIAVGVGPALPAMWQWSKTASSNATADPNINWAEGQSPSSVNDSARAMMAALASWRDDNSGLLVDSGSASAYVVTTNEGINAVPNNGQKVVFVPANTNNAGITLQVDGGTVYPLQSSPGVAIGASILVAGTPYSVTFNNSANAWILHSFYGGPFIVPLGAVLDYTGSSAPNANFALAFGQAISRTTYAGYFSLVSTTFGSGDGVTTFNIPDFRGRIIAGIDNMGGTNAARLSGCANNTTMGGVCGAQNQTLSQGNLPNVNFNVTDPGHTHGLNSVLIGNSGGGINLFSPNGSGGAIITSSSTTGISVNSGGSGTAVPTVQPTLMINKIVRIF